MLISAEFLKKTIDTVKHVNELYNLYALDPRTNVKSTDYLRLVCSGNLEKNIEFYCHPNPASDDSSIKGFYFSRADGSYEIALLSGLNFCWQRLVLCKEIFHVILDEDRTRHESVNQLLDDLSAQLILENGIRKQSDIPFQTEFMAEIAAMEFLFPYKERLLKVNNGAPDFAQIAEQYKVPKRYVEMYLSDSYMIPLKDFCLN